MPKSGEVSLSLSGSQVSAIKRPTSASSGRQNGPSPGPRGPSTRPGSSGGNRSGRGGGQAPLSARSVTFGSNQTTPRSSRKAVGDKVSPAIKKEGSLKNSYGPSGDLNGILSNGSVKGSGTTRHKRASSLTNLSSNRSMGSEGSSTTSLLKSKEMPSTDDFLALFDSNEHKPVIKDRTSNRSKKGPAKKQHEPVSSRAFAIPLSARSTSTVSTSGPHSSRPGSGFDMNSNRINSSRDVTPRLHPEDSISSRIDPKDLVRSSLSKALNSVQSGQRPQVQSGQRPQDMDDDLVPNEESVYRPNSSRGRTHSLEHNGSHCAADFRGDLSENEVGGANVNSVGSRVKGHSEVEEGRRSHRDHMDSIEDNRVRGHTEVKRGKGSLEQSGVGEGKSDSVGSSQNRGHMRTEEGGKRSHDQDGRAHPMAEELIRSMNDSATKIQRWYRGRRKEKAAEGQDEIRRVLRAKWQERAEMMERERRGKELGEKKEKDRKRIREEKQRLARQAAIEELQKKRDEKNQDIKRKAEEEMKFLEASGKVRKKPTGKKSSRKQASQTGQLAASSDPSPEKEPSSHNPLPGGQIERQGTGSSLGKKVEEIFQSGSSPRSPGREEDDVSAENAPETPSAASHTKTTLDDLLDTLKLLEEPVRVPTPDQKNRSKGPAWLDIFDEKEDPAVESTHLSSQRLRVPSSSKDPVYLSADNLQELTSTEGPPKQAKEKTTSHALLTEQKLKNIMSFLDEIDQTDPDSVSQLNAKEGDETLNPPMIVPSAEEILKLEEASAAASEVTSTILSQRLQLEERERSIKMLQKGLNQQRELTVRHAKEQNKETRKRLELQKEEYETLNQQRELTVRHAKEQDKETKKRLVLQKEEYETTMKRHLSFIDQLIDDKKALSEKYDYVVKELKQVDKKYQTRIKAMDENHGIELRKVKDVQQAAEKIRREKWIDEKTKKIKEITVKGLEPEIQRLIASHKAEIKKVKTIHEAELLQAEERAGQKYIHHTEELREQLAHEKEQACARERELSKQRYEKQLEQEEASFQQQRRRLYQDVQEEKERLAEQAKKQRQELDRLQHQMEENNRKALATLREEYEKARDEQDRRHKSEVKDLHERLKIEKESWEENYMKKQETVLVSKERDLKEKVRAERDKEIELVITRLEEDAATAREETERGAENRIKRIRDKYEAELKEIELSERNTQERYNEIKAKLSEVEAESFRSLGLLKQRDQEVEDVKKVCSRLTSERNNVQEVIRQEFADRLVATEEENKRVKNEMSEMRARHKLEISRIETTKEEEMEEVHRRVKQAISKKEEVVSQLREQHASAVKRADHLESLLEQQRKQLVKKK